MLTPTDALNANPRLHIDVGYYNALEQARLAAYTAAPAIAYAVTHGVDVSVADFLTYSLFVNQETGDPGSENFSDLRTKIITHLYTLQDSLRMNGSNLFSLYPRLGARQKHGVTERVGVGITLSIISEIHGLIAADWERIKETPKTKTLDFEVCAKAANGGGHIMVEAKGRSVRKASLSAGHFRKEAEHIGAKKTAYRSQPLMIWPVASYGCIAVLGTSPIETVKCWLLDPPALAPRREPRHQQLLNRLNFARRVLTLVMPRSQLLPGIRNNIHALTESPTLDTFVWQKPEPHQFDDWNDFGFRHVTDEDRRTAGRIIRLQDGAGFFIGVSRDLVDRLHAPDFDRLLARQLSEVYSADSFLIGDPIAFEKKGDTPDMMLSNRARPRLRFGRAHLNFTSSGLVFGSVSTEANRVMPG